MVEIYIVKNDGVLLYYNSSDKNKKQRVENAALFSGIISAIKSFLKELEIGDVQTFSTDENTIFIQTRSDLAYVFVINKKSNVDEKTVFNFLDEYSKEVCEIIDEKNTESWNDRTFNDIDEITDRFLNKLDSLIKESKITKNLMDVLW